MGWKSTVYIKRAEAMQLILARLLNATDEQIADAVEALGYGDELSLDYHGHNFIVNDEAAERENK